MAVFYTRNVAPQESGSLFYISLRQLLVDTHVTQPGTNHHVKFPLQEVGNAKPATPFGRGKGDARSWEILISRTATCQVYKYSFTLNYWQAYSQSAAIGSSKRRGGIKPTSSKVSISKAERIRCFGVLSQLRNGLSTLSWRLLTNSSKIHSLSSSRPSNESNCPRSSLHSFGI